MTWLDVVILVVKCLVLALAATGMFAYFTLFERRTLARRAHVARRDPRTLARSVHLLHLRGGG